MLKENDTLTTPAKSVNKRENDVPEHIAVIMDGNGRWAKSKKMPRTIGHRQGTIATKKIVKACGELNIGYLTIYVFSSENWRRPKLEINALMKLLIDKIRSEIGELNDENVKLMATGDLDKLPQGTRDELEWGIEKTRNNTGLKLILALSYGGRQEIVDACKKIARQVKENNLDIENITEEVFTSNLYHPDVPDPELLIRTGGDLRISNFLLWQIAYTEIYVTSTLWPNFDKQELLKAIEYYQNTQRNFGKVTR